MNSNDLVKLVYPFSKECAAVDFESICDSRNWQLPEDFVSFYTQFNGFYLKDNDFQLVFYLPKPFWQHNKLELHGLLSASDMVFHHPETEGISHPYGTLCFVVIELAEICISLRDDSYGNIFFCEKDPYPGQLEHSDEPLEVELKKFNPSKGRYSNLVLKLSNNFTDFISELKVERW